MDVVKEFQKDVEEFNALDFLKMFLRMYKQEYGHGYQVSFSRDCALMSKVLGKIHMCGRDNEEAVKFMRWAWKRKDFYSQGSHKKMRVGLLYSVVDDYLEEKGFKRESFVTKSKSQLDEDIKSWLTNRRKK